jgi:PAS domain-containing protein
MMYLSSSTMVPKDEPVPDTHRCTGRVTLIRYFAWDLACACGIALVYFLSARIALRLIVQPEGIAVMWPPSGLLLAALVLRSRRSWPLTLLAVGAAMTTADLIHGQTVAVSLGFALANCTESVVAAWLLVRCLGTPIKCTSLREVLGLLGLAAFASNALTALLGAAVSSLGFSAPFWQVWRVWWVGDGVGMLLVTPVILTWATVDVRVFKTLTLRQDVEALCLVASLAVLSVAGFSTLLVAAVMNERKGAETKFRNLLESAPDAMVIVNSMGEIVLINAQTETLFGYTRAELLGQSVELLMPARFQTQHLPSRLPYFSQPSVRPMGTGLDLYGLPGLRL